jgi:hypothetical protein
MDRIKDEKAQLLSEIVEAEKQILLWERKINLEREMQETLDPNYGQKEIQELKKEIHRMELRLDDIRKKQENVILEMERAVYKRETIQLKYIDKDKQGQKSKLAVFRYSGSDQVLDSESEADFGNYHQEYQNH